jgi:histidine ammonia-lyase
MATFAARKLGDMAENTAIILAIELLAAAQGVDLRGPYPTSPRLREVMKLLRTQVAHYDLDHYFAPDIAVATRLVQAAEVAAHAPFAFASQPA